MSQKKRRSITGLTAKERQWVGLQKRKGIYHFLSFRLFCTSIHRLSFDMGTGWIGRWKHISITGYIKTLSKAFKNFKIGKPFPPNFSHIAESIMKRLFRIYAHIYHQHFGMIEQLKAIEHLNTSFKHFILFVQEFNLIEPKHLEPLDELIKKFISKWLYLVAY